MFYAYPSSYCTIPPKAFQAIKEFGDKYKAADAKGKDKLLDELCREIQENEARKKAREREVLGYFRPPELAHMPRFPKLGKLVGSPANAHR